MFGLFKLKKKSKKDKNKAQGQDDEKENTSSPTKVKKIENVDKDVKSESIKVEEQTPINITVEGLHNTPSVPRKAMAGKSLTIETANLESMASHGSPLSSATTTLNIHQARCPMLSASDAHTNSFVRGNYLSSTISGSDLHRFLNSGYMNGDPYLQRGVELKTPKSPHFHRPPNFSYTHGPRYVTPHQRHMSANRVSASSSDAPRYNRTLTPSGITRNRSSSPSQFHANQQQNETVEHITKEDGSTAIVTTIRSTRNPVVRDLDTEEPIRLAKFPGGHQPDPSEEPRIESLDWPSPPYPAAVPELRARSRSSSNRRAPSTINSIHGTQTTSVNGDGCGGEEEVDSEDETDFVNDEEVQQVLTNTSYLSHENNRQSTGAHSVSSSLARVKASRPNSKLRYHNNLFDNDYDDYMLRYKADKDWRKMLNKSTLSRTFGDSSVAGDSYGDINSNTNHNETTTTRMNELDEDDEMREAVSEASKSEESAEVKKIRTQSGMAAELFSEVEAQQKKMLAHKLRVDPWKASRSPNAKEMPSVRTRYESPVNASPSRVYNYHNRSLMTSAMSGHTLSPTPLQSQTASATFIGDISLVNNTPVTPTHQAYNNDVAMTTTAQHMGHQPLTPKSVYSLGRNNVNNQLFTSNSNSRVISSSCLPKAGLNSTSNSIVYNMAVPRPGYGLTSTNKSITLPNSARYVGFTPNMYDYAASNRSCASPVSCSEQVYPYEALRRNKEKKPVLPADVDRERLERHLGAEEFQQLFGMNRDQFYELPEWQRVNLKKRVKLF